LEPTASLGRRIFENVNSAPQTSSPWFAVIQAANANRKIARLVLCLLWRPGVVPVLCSKYARTWRWSRKSQKGRRGPSRTCFRKVPLSRENCPHQSRIATDRSGYQQQNGEQIRSRNGFGRRIGRLDRRQFRSVHCGANRQPACRCSSKIEVATASRVISCRQWSTCLTAISDG
jgi:hypothetical protein